MLSSFMSVARPLADTTILGRHRFATDQPVNAVTPRLRFADVVEELGAHQCPDDRLSRFVGDFAGHRQAAIQDELGHRFPTALDTELAARQPPSHRLEARVIDVHVNLAHRDRYTVEVPLPRGVGLQSGADTHLLSLAGTLFEFDTGPDVTPSMGLPCGVDDDSPDRPGRLQLGREAGRDRLHEPSDDQRAQYGP